MALPDQKGKKLVAVSHMSDKSKDRVVAKLREAIDEINAHPAAPAVQRYNAMVLGQQMYYRMATRVGKDFADIEHRLYLHRSNQLKGFMKEYRRSKCPVKLGPAYLKYYGSTNYKVQMVMGVALFPVQAVVNKRPLGFTQGVCNYTPEGRELIHKSLRPDIETMVQYLASTTPAKASIELADNRLSRYAMQNGRCAVTQEILVIGEMELHHKIPKAKGGTDEFNNLIWVTTDVHKLIHATDPDTIARYLARVSLDTKGMTTLNNLRELAGNTAIK